MTGFIIIIVPKLHTSDFRILWIFCLWLLSPVMWSLTVRSSIRFLWRKNSTFAISRHYRRFDVFEEAEANKAAGKYDNASIDDQIEFYRNEGLTHYSTAKLPITSGQWTHQCTSWFMGSSVSLSSTNLCPFALCADVPEGCVIIREHVPISNLFTCLWFNEVDHFTARDQISFSTVRDKIRAKVGWMPQMFLDCERRNFVVQVLHLLRSNLCSPRHFLHAH